MQQAVNDSRILRVGSKAGKVGCNFTKVGSCSREVGSKSGKAGSKSKSLIAVRLPEAQDRAIDRLFEAVFQI
ncbi:hypothetical protein [Metabacillus sp. cB07]|uniref:hypothetical protein n=1 Tax=Metabacillus sp. cB07 TaxID=2806989 RepID=UPI0019393A23|nr:hypothetical protein [Metabacillus sp. cB07]